MKRRSLYMIGGIVFLLANIFLFAGTSVFVFSHVVSESMMPTVLKGDYVVSCQFIPGWRLAHTDNDMVSVKRIFPLSTIERNDLVVFNFPYVDNGWRMIYNTGNYYIKRCVGLPGDTVAIVDGACYVNNDIFSEETLYIPKQGDSITLNKENYLSYWRCIDYETRMDLEYRDSAFFANGKKVDHYVFQKNYYFMLGDNRKNSNDSRHWGLLPEDFIVGKSLFVGYSVDPDTKRIRFDRIGEKLY